MFWYFNVLGHIFFLWQAVFKYYRPKVYRELPPDISAFPHPRPSLCCPLTMSISRVWTNTMSVSTASGLHACIAWSIMCKCLSLLSHGSIILQSDPVIPFPVFILSWLFVVQWYIWLFLNGIVLVVFYLDSSRIHWEIYHFSKFEECTWSTSFCFECLTSSVLPTLKFSVLPGMKFTDVKFGFRIVVALLLLLFFLLLLVLVSWCDNAAATLCNIYT